MRGFFMLYGVYLRDWYNNCLWELFLCGLTAKTATGGGEDEKSLLVGAYKAGDTIIIHAVVQ